MKGIRRYKITLLLSMLAILIPAQFAWPLENQKSQLRPIQLGTSGGSIRDSSRFLFFSTCCGGTLGALVQDVFGTQYILSNNHVMAKTNRGFLGDAITQPGLIDENPVCARDFSDIIGNLWGFVPISFGRGTSNTVDAAIALVQSGKVDPTGSILGIGTVSNSIVAPTLGMQVKKSGRTTGLTTGTITAVNVTVNVSYTQKCGGLGFQVARFTNQIRIEPKGFGDFSSGGDSGSLIVEDCSPNPRAVGLLFAGGDNDTFANPIGNVLSAFGVSMVGAGGFCSLPTTSAGADNLAIPAQSQLVETLSRIKERYEDAILHIEGVVGMGVGLSDTDPGQLVIETYVKRPAQEMKPILPERLENILVKIVETGEVIAY